MSRKTTCLDEAVTILRILQRIPKNRKITANEILDGLVAAGIPIHIRTLQRYLKAIADTPALGIECDTRTRPYGYKQSLTGGKLLEQQISVHEGLLLRLAQEHMRFMIPAELTKSLSPLFDTAQQKFNESSTTKRARDWLKKVAVVSSTLPMTAPKISPTIFNHVSEALFREVKLEVEYHNRQGRLIQGLVSPLGLVQQDVRLYLVCRFDNYDNVRHLALHRLDKATPTPFTVERPKDFKLDTYVKSRHFNYTDGTGDWVRLSFRFKEASLARNLEETPFNASQRIEQLPDGDFRLTVDLEDSPLIDGWLAVTGRLSPLSDVTRTPIEPEKA